MSKKQTVEMIPALHSWRTNGHLIRDAVVPLGYLRQEWWTLDPTYGIGTFWKLWKPDLLVACDGNPKKSPYGEAVDFRDLPWDDGAFHACVYDPPYKLNGTPDPDVDGIYGTDVPTRWQDRIALMKEGMVECARVVDKGGILLVKCQDMVSSGAVRWQTDIMARMAKKAGVKKIDRFDMTGTTREQPMEGRNQKHAHGRPSTLLVFRKS